MKITHSQRVHEYLLENGSITSWEAIREFGNTRLSATIYNLRRAGLNIITKDEASKNRYGDTVHYARYYIVTNEEV